MHPLSGGFTVLVFQVSIPSAQEIFNADILSTQSVNMVMKACEALLMCYDFATSASSQKIHHMHPAHKLVSAMQYPVQLT